MSARTVSTGSPLLEIKDVHKRFERIEVLKGVDLDIGRGEAVAVIGASGSGKTTLLRCFSRLVEPDTGVIRVGGEDASSLDPVALRRRIGYVQQEGGLLPHWRVHRNVALVPALRGDTDARARAEAALGLVGLPAHTFGERWPRELSGGQRQRVAIARALAHEPAIVLLDEPFGALDALTRADLHETFLALRSRLGIAMLLVTHDLLEAARLADRIAVVRAGRIEQIAAPADLRASPATEYVGRLIARVAWHDR
jgi:osmoprotectant transport system ATP-binding protein